MGTSRLWRVSLTSALVLSALLITVRELRAQTLPAPWAASDVGAPDLAGRSDYSGDVFTIDAAGSGIWSTSDQFHFVWQRIAGDAEIIARVDSIAAAHSWSKAGVMIRRSLSASSAHAYASSAAGKGVNFQRRPSDGAASASTVGSNTRPPAWVRAVRRGSTVSTYRSTDGVNWTPLGQQTIALDASAYYGIAVASHNSNQRTIALVSNVSIIPGGLPPGQQSMDIGNPAIPGAASYVGGAYSVEAAGAGIWDTADQFHFVYQPMTGDGEAIARVTSVQRVTSWSKAGVMMRESLSAESRHAMMALSAGNGYAFQRRPETAGDSLHTAGPAGTAPGWVRLVRTGDLFVAYQSIDGSTWTEIGSETVLMGATIYVGLAVSSHSTSASTTALIDNLEITAVAPPANQPPAISITSPANGAQFTAPTDVTIAATATDPETRMASVDFYADATLIARDTTAPYSVSWSATIPGTYALTATAYDEDGGSTTSSAVSITIEAANQPPAVSLTSPANGATFTAPATINLEASASDPEGPLARVEFYSGTTLLATDTTSPYSFSWGNVPAGSYSLTARAYDAAGAQATSGALSVTVSSANAAPTVSLTSPANGASYTSPASINLSANASDPEGELERVEFFSGTTRLASVASAPYTYSWTSVPAGTYTLTAVAYDSGGASATSAAVTVTVAAATSTPPRYVVFTASSDHATNVTGYVFEVFASGADPTTATPVATADMGKPTPAADGDITSDQLNLFNNLAPGTYVATVRAFGPGGTTRSASLSFTR